MGLAYQAVGWNRQKRIYDAWLVGGVALYLATFVALGAALFPHVTAETLLIRGFGTAAFLLLHVVLSIGPLARLDRRFLPLLYNRRHMGVTMFVLALAHGGFALVQFHALGDVNPLVSLLVSNTRFDSLSQFPFQPLGAAALVILFLMAATSHDFWLANLTAPVWKALHMAVYLAWALIGMHVVLGVLQAETSPVPAALVGIGAVWIIALHLAAGWRGRALDREREGAEWVDAGPADTIPMDRARIVCVSGERVAIFRHEGGLSAVSNVCQHQNGPLGEGRVIDGCITCPWHGYQYRPRDGRSPEPFTERIPTFRVRVQDGRVEVDPRPLPAGTEVEPAPLDGDAPTDAEELYIGWSPQATPRAAARVRTAVAAVLLVAVGVAAGLSVSQRPFPAKVFEFGSPRELVGTVFERPYPTLAVARPGHTGSLPAESRYLLVAEGKHGAAEAVAGLDGQRVRLSGTLVYRGDQTLIELVAGTIEPVTGSVRSEPGAPESLGSLTLRGEIVDSKCYLGVMSPGHGKPHRACATRCIAGGIPPVLRVRDEEDRVAYFLLVGSDGRTLNREVLDFVAEPVEITGEVRRQDDLLVLWAEPADIRRLEEP